MTVSKEEVARISAAVGYDIPASELEDFVGLMDKAKAAFEAVEAMDGQLTVFPLASHGLNSCT